MWCDMTWHGVVAEQCSGQGPPLPSHSRFLSATTELHGFHTETKFLSGPELNKSHKAHVQLIKPTVLPKLEKQKY